ncbi:hypothetical protein V6N13_093892 [Hibiscus sabdariffa]
MLRLFKINKPSPQKNSKKETTYFKIFIKIGRQRKLKIEEAQYNPSILEVGILASRRSSSITFSFLDRCFVFASNAIWVVAEVKSSIRRDSSNSALVVEFDKKCSSATVSTPAFLRKISLRIADSPSTTTSSGARRKGFSLPFV